MMRLPKFLKSLALVLQPYHCVSITSLSSFCAISLVSACPQHFLKIFLCLIHTTQSQSVHPPPLHAFTKLPPPLVFCISSKKQNKTGKSWQRMGHWAEQTSFSLSKQVHLLCVCCAQAAGSLRLSPTAACNHGARALRPCCV